MSLVESIRDDLVKVFTQPQADVLSQCVVRAHDALATKSDMHELRGVMIELVETQKETSAEVGRLAVAQSEMSTEVKRLAVAHVSLAEAQKETSTEVKRLAVSQAETSAEVKQMAMAQAETSAEVRRLAVAQVSLAEAQTETSAEVRRLAVAQTSMAEAQAETSAEVRRLAVAQTSLAEAQTETSAEVRRLAVSQAETSAEVGRLAVSQSALMESQREVVRELADLNRVVGRLSVRSDKTAGWALEWLVGKHLPAYLGTRIRRCRIVGVMDVVESLEADVAQGTLTAEDVNEFRRADLVATGMVDGETLYLVGEVSCKSDNDDVLRAARRAAVLGKAGRRVQSFVACEAIDPIPAELARREGVWVIQEGRLLTAAG
jgi:hypothetical protein